MSLQSGTTFRILPIIALLLSSVVYAQGNAGTVRGTVTDPTGAVIPNATVHLTNQVSGLDRTTTSDATGKFTFPNIPFNPYRISATANGSKFAR
jgi:Carboxypeptidase regulatory-like domain